MNRVHPMIDLTDVSTWQSSHDARTLICEHMDRIHNMIDVSYVSKWKEFTL